MWTLKIEAPAALHRPRPKQSCAGSGCTDNTARTPETLQAKTSLRRHCSAWSASDGAPLQKKQNAVRNACRGEQGIQKTDTASEVSLPYGQNTHLQGGCATFRRRSAVRTAGRTQACERRL